MKSRLGFVSNSSSSSFIIITNLDKESLQNKLIDEFRVPFTHPLYDICNKIADVLFKSIDFEGTAKQYAEEISYDDWREYAKEISYDDWDEFEKHKRKEVRLVVEADKNNYKIYAGSVSNQAEEYLLYKHGFDIDNDGFILYKEARY